MHRRGFLALSIGVSALTGLTGRWYPPPLVAATDPANKPKQRLFPPIYKDLDAWRALLTEAQFHILFEEGTERPWSSPLNDEKRPGTYLCAACLLPLFLSDTKYDSRTGWPSFYAAIEGHLATKTDYKLLLPRTEYHCARCSGHQGHVFDDGPQPTGKRWCNNGLALLFVVKGSPLPELRR